MASPDNQKKQPVSKDSLPLSTPSTAPDFARLLASPIVKAPLPAEFDAKVESAHLRALWESSKDLQAYTFHEFVFAGGSGMVFRVTSKADLTLAAKIARAKLFTSKGQHGAATALSPVSPRELRALEQISHPNVVRLEDAIANEEHGTFAIFTSYVEKPQPLDELLIGTLRKPRRKKGAVEPFSLERLDDACRFLVSRFHEVSSALAYMHSLGFYHCDVKPANILIHANKTAILTDLGASVHREEAKSGPLRIQFTWAYAHPHLRDVGSDPRSISDGGLKATARFEARDNLERIDLFALGRTIQEALAHLVHEFGERCYAAYGFRFLHLLAALLLDGQNSALKDKIEFRDGKRFVSDTAMGYPVQLFAALKIATAADLVSRLARFNRDFSWNDEIPELDPWQPDTINTGPSGTAPFTERVEKVFSHPGVRRLKEELQLGWMREVYPGATHTRWSHSLGVFAATAEYYKALVADPEVPTARLLLTPADIQHGLVAAMLHDVGQTSFAHDIEAVNPRLFRHESLVKTLLSDDQWGHPTLGELIREHWGNVDLKRVLEILDNEGRYDAHPVDGLAHDIINGPIDADKFDYLVRDAESCGVAYGLGIDKYRFLRALTVDIKRIGTTSRLAIAYRAKGAAAIESLLVARYQMYGAVYWHHTFRCIQSMFVHAAAATFGSLGSTSVELRGANTDLESVKAALYERVICANSLDVCKQRLKQYKLPIEFFRDPPAFLGGERALEFVWRFADDRNRELIKRVAQRSLFRRVYEARVADLGGIKSFSALASALSPEARIAAAERVEEEFLKAIHKKMSQSEPTPTSTGSMARERYQELQGKGVPLVVLDFPVRGIPEERNVPREISDPSRKYISGRKGHAGDRNVFGTVRDLQVAIATARVFAAKEFHELIVRYLDPDDVQACVETAVPALRTQD